LHLWEEWGGALAAAASVLLRVCLLLLLRIGAVAAGPVKKARQAKAELRKRTGKRFKVFWKRWSGEIRSRKFFPPSMKPS